MASEPIYIYFATTPDWRGIAEWSKVLTGFVLVIVWLSDYSVLEYGGSIPVKGILISLWPILTYSYPSTEYEASKNHYLCSNIIYFHRFYSKNL